MLAAFAASLILGFSKSGFKGLGFIVVTLMAIAYESKASTGILLPLLMVGDAIAVVYYRRDVHWKTLFQLFIPMAVGVVIGVFVGKEMPVEIFKRVMAFIIFISGILLLIMQRVQTDKVPNNKFFAIIMGLGAGFCTMIGNLAGAFANVYFLAMRFPKRKFIGTSAWLFFLINIFKLPFHIFVWGTVNAASFQENLKLAPFVIVGFFIGIRLIEKISNAFFQRYIIAMTIIGAIIILLK